MDSTQRENWDFVDDSTRFYHLAGVGEEQSVFMIHEKNLAISFKVVPELLKTVLRLFQKTAKLPWQEDSALYRQISDYTQCLLSLSAECYTAWNVRRHMAMDNSETMSKSLESQRTYLQNELKFINLVLSKNPKSSESWSYRLVRTFTAIWLTDIH